MAIVVRSDLPVASIIDVMRGSVRAVDPQLALVDARPLSDLIGRTFEIQRLAVWITTAFGGVGLLLSAVGIYGVVAYAAATRTREVGVRMACGASAGQILRLMIAQHLRVVTVGLALGVLVSALVTTILAASPVRRAQARRAQPGGWSGGPARCRGVGVCDSREARDARRYRCRPCGPTSPLDAPWRAWRAMEKSISPWNSTDSIVGLFVICHSVL